MIYKAVFLVPKDVPLKATSSIKEAQREARAKANQMSEVSGCIAKVLYIEEQTRIDSFPPEAA